MVRVGEFLKKPTVWGWGRLLSQELRRSLSTTLRIPSTKIIYASSSVGFGFGGIGIEQVNPNLLIIENKNSESTGGGGGSGTKTTPSPNFQPTDKNPHLRKKTVVAIYALPTLAACTLAFMIPAKASLLALSIMPFDLTANALGAAILFPNLGVGLLLGLGLHLIVRSQRRTQKSGILTPAPITQPMKRANERPLLLRGVIIASKVVMVPWAGFCIGGVFTPIVIGVSAVSLLSSVISIAFLFLLWHEWHFISDVSKSLRVSENYPPKGTWPVTSQKIKPAITITALPESATLVDGTVAASLRTLSRYGRGDVFLITDARKMCSKFGKEALADKWNRRIKQRDAIKLLLLSVINSKRIVLGDGEGIKPDSQYLHQLFVEVGENCGMEYWQIRNLAKHIFTIGDFPDTPMVLIARAGEIGMPLEYETSRKIIGGVRNQVAEQVALEVSDFIALNYQKEMEVSIRYLCEQHGLSRELEVKLIDEVCVLKTIKERILAEGIDELANPRERVRALRRLIGEIADANWIPKEDATWLVEKWLTYADAFILLDSKKMRCWGVSAEILEELDSIVTREERRETISVLGEKLLSRSPLSRGELNKLINLLFDEFRITGISQVEFWQLVTQISLLGEGDRGLPKWEGAVICDFMRKQYAQEEKFSLKELLRTFIAFYGRMPNGKAEELAVRTIGVFREIAPQISLDNIPWEITVDALERSLKKNITDACNTTCLTKMLFREFLDMRANVDYATSCFISKVTEQMSKMTHISVGLSRLTTADEVARALKLIVLQEQLSEEFLPIFIDYVQQHLNLGRPLGSLADCLYSQLAEVAMVGIMEYYKLTKWDAPPTHQVDVREILGGLQAYEEDWPNSAFSYLTTHQKNVLAYTLRGVVIQKTDIIATAVEGSLRACGIDIPKQEAFQFAQRLICLGDKRLNMAQRMLAVDRLSHSTAVGLGVEGGLLLALRAMGGCAKDQNVSHPLDSRTTNKVYFVHRADPLGEKPGSLADATGGKSIESRVRDLVHLAISTSVQELTLGHPTVHAYPKIITAIDRNICANLARLRMVIRGKEIPLVIDPEVFLEQLVAEHRGYADFKKCGGRSSIADLILDQLSLVAPPRDRPGIIRSWKILQRECYTAEEIGGAIIEVWDKNKGLRGKIREEILKIAPTVIGGYLGPRNTSEIVEQIITQSNLPEEAEICGEKHYLASTLRFLVPFIENSLNSLKDNIDFKKLSRIGKIKLIEGELKNSVKARRLECSEGQLLCYALSCLDSKIPPLNVSYDMFVQFDSEHHPQRDYITENGAYLLAHPSLFLVQTRHHYARNLYAHPLTVGTNAQQSIFSEHIAFAKTYDNAVFPTGSGMLLPRDAWVFGGEWNEEIEYRRAIDNDGHLTGQWIAPLLNGLNRIPLFGGVLSVLTDFIYSHTVLQLRDLYWISGIPQRYGKQRGIYNIGGRIYYQPEDTVTEDIAAGSKYHRLGYLSISSPGIHHLAKGPSGLNHFMATQLHRWARGGMGELRMKRPRGSNTILRELIVNRKDFSGAQRLQYLRATSYFLTGISNFVVMSAPLLLLTVALSVTSSPITLPLVIVISLNLAIKTWLFPISMKQRGVGVRESISLIGLTLLNWERWWHAAYFSLVKRVKGQFGVTKKWGVTTKIDLSQKEGRRLGIGPIGMMAANAVAFPLGLYYTLTMGAISPIVWGVWGLLSATVMVASWWRYNKGTSPLPPKNGKALLKTIRKTDDLDLVESLMAELKNPERGYAPNTIKQAAKSHGEKVSRRF